MHTVVMASAVPPEMAVPEAYVKANAR